MRSRVASGGMTMQPTSVPALDIVAVVTVVATWAFGGEIAQILGPYAVIILSALGGAAWSASRRRSDEREPPLNRRLGTVLHIVLSVGLALIATVPASELVAQWAGTKPSWMFGIVAALIAARPDWLWQRLRDLLMRRAP